MALRFLYKTTADKQLFGNIHQLTMLADAKHGDTGLLGPLNLLFGDVPRPAVATLALGVLLNLTAPFKRQSVFSFLLVALAATGFFIFADCCSYDRRNSVWVFAFLIPAAFSGFITATGWFARGREAASDTGPDTGKA